jgi:hypothetical protein
MDKKGVNLSDMDDAWRFAVAIEKSGVAPKGMGAAAIFAVVQAGAEFGLSPMASLSNMKTINGRTGPMGKVAKAKVIASGFIHDQIRDEMVGQYGELEYCCRVTSKRKGHSQATVTEFSIADAKRAKKWGSTGPWTDYPKQMLYYRALGFHLDKVYPDVMVGFVIAEALGDYPETEVKGVVLQPLSNESNDPILDLLPEGKTQADLHAHFEKTVGFEPDSSTGNETLTQMDDAQKASILERLEKNDAKLDEANPDNSAVEGADSQPDLL